MGIQYHEDEAVMDDRDNMDSTAECDDADEFAETAVLEIDEDSQEPSDDNVSDEEAYKPEGPVGDCVGYSSVVFDVDNLVAEFEAETGDPANHSNRLRRRLEAIAERKRRHDDLLDFADYDLDA